MKLKQIPQDFVVDEIFDLKKFEDRDEERPKPYYYFILKKTNYNQLDALMRVAKTFNTSKKLVHFAGTKDKVGMTSQVISVYGIREDNFDKNLEYFNNYKDLNLEFLGKFKGRVNLGDNLGNSFKIVVRDLNEKDIDFARERIDDISRNGALNFFDSQRFGYANNSHIVGKYVLRNDVKSAVKEILTSCPKDASSDLIDFTSFIRDNFDEVELQNSDVIDEAISLCPKFLRGEVLILEHLKKYKNDFPGAFRKIHKKLRTIYVNAYQSYVFNETIKILKGENSLESYTEIPLVTFDIELDEKFQVITQELLQKDGLNFDSFKLPSMPELKLGYGLRQTRVFPKELAIGDVLEDELNENKKKVIVTFGLESGAYATNVISQLFER